MFRIIIILKYDTKRIKMILFNCLLKFIFKNVKMQILLHLCIYLIHVTYAIESHTIPYKDCTTSMFNSLIHVTSLKLRFSIPYLIPNMTIKLKLIDLSLITKKSPYIKHRQSNLNKIEQILTYNKYFWL